jgi:hypothetical protein
MGTRIMRAYRFTPLCILVVSIALTGPPAQASPPPEVHNLAWCAGTKDCLQWSAAGGASTQYRVYSGDQFTLPALLTSEGDSCRVGQYSATTTGSMPRAWAHPCILSWYLVVASRNGEEGPAGSSSFGPEILNGGNCPCAQDYQTCTFPGECCSRLCVSGVCLPACVGDGSPCGSSADCCSGSCNSSVCDSCETDGRNCSEGSECCGAHCEASVCRTCAVDSEPCSTSADCCGSFVCTDGRCHDVFCEPVGWPYCVLGGQCCSGLCSGGHSGAGVCLACASPGEPCLMFDNTCCRGTCTDSKCPVDCSLAGEPCTEASPCCPGSGLVCTQGRCRVPCQPGGTSCGASGECCSGVCGANLCRTTCTSDGNPCTGDGDCCNFSCAADGLCRSPVCSVTP